MSKQFNRGAFDFRNFSSDELEKRVKAASTDVRKINRRLNGEPIKCDGCGYPEANRDRLRLGHDAQGEEIIVCRECGQALYGRGISTAPFGAVMKSDLERIENAISAMKAELTLREKRAADQAEREKALEVSGFLDRFKKREEPVKSGNGADPEPILAESETNNLSDGEALH